MPIYEYRCENCGHEMEAIQKISEAPLVDCPLCEAARLRKRISRVAFRLKGSGWYETDFKSGQQKNLAGGDEGANKDQPDGDGGKAAESASDSGKGEAGKDEGAKKTGGKTEPATGNSGAKAADGAAAKAASAAASE